MAIQSIQNIHSILLCPGFTHKDVAGLAEAVGGGVSVSVARADRPGSRVARKIMKNEGYFSRAVE